MSVNMTSQARAVAARQTQIGADWFFWIAGLSLVNSVLALSGARFQFVVGLGSTALVNAFGREMGGSGKGIAFVLDLLIAGVFALFGLFARKGQLWAFVVGMVLYLLDALLVLLFKDWLAVAFHGYALWRIFAGMQAAQRLQALAAQEAREMVQSRTSAPTPGVWPPPPTA